MDLNDNFETAVSRSRELPVKPTNDELLQLYALFKQGSEGDVTGERPGGFDFKGAAKYDAWEKLKGMDSHKAKEAYVKLVNDLFEKYG